MCNAWMVIFLHLFIRCNGARERHIEYYVNQWTAKVVGHMETAKRIADIEGLEVREVSIGIMLVTSGFGVYSRFDMIITDPRDSRYAVIRAPSAPEKSSF